MNMLDVRANYVIVSEYFLASTAPDAAYPVADRDSSITSLSLNFLPVKEGGGGGGGHGVMV